MYIRGVVHFPTTTIRQRIGKAEKIGSSRERSAAKLGLDLHQPNAREDGTNRVHGWGLCFFGCLDCRPSAPKHIAASRRVLRAPASRPFAPPAARPHTTPCPACSPEAPALPSRDHRPQHPTPEPWTVLRELSPARAPSGQGEGTEEGLHVSMYSYNGSAQKARPDKFCVVSDWS